MPKGGSSWSAWGAAVAFFTAGLFPLFNADAYRHLAQGRQIAELGRVPEVDSFSFWRAEPQSSSNYEWAYDLLTWWVYEPLGANSLIFLKCVALAVLGFALVTLSTHLARGAALAGPFALSALLLCLPLARLRFAVGPQVVGLVFPALLLLGVCALYRDDATRKTRASVLAALGLLHVAWVNMHASHLFGLVITLIFIACAIRTTALPWLLGLLALQVAATACTPFGLGSARDAIAHLARPEYRELAVDVSAWSPDDPLRLLVAPAVACVFVLIAARPVVRESRFGLGYALLCLVLSVVAFLSVGLVGHQLLFCAPFIGAGLASRSKLAATRGAPVLVALTAAVSVFWVTQIVPSFGFGLGAPKGEHPWASAEMIERSVDGPRIVAGLQDSWVLMFAAPSAKLLTHGRGPFHGPEMVAEVGATFVDPARLADRLERFDANVVVIDHTRPDHIAATNYLDDHDDWGLLFVEDRHSLFARLAVVDAAQPLVAVAPGYRVGRLLDADIDASGAAEETARLRGHLNTEVMRAWHRGLALLRPLARDGGRAGIRRASTDEERRLARAAYDALALPSKHFPGLTAIELHRSMAALAACAVRPARVAHGRALYGGQNRETSFVGLELALRAGKDPEREGALERLQQLLREPEAASDPWLMAIAEASADRATRCR